MTPPQPDASVFGSRHPEFASLQQTLAVETQRLISLTQASERLLVQVGAQPSISLEDRRQLVSQLKKQAQTWHRIHAIQTAIVLIVRLDNQQHSEGRG